MMTADLWALTAAGLVIGGVVAWVARRRQSRMSPRTTDTGRISAGSPPTCEGIGPPRDPTPD